MRDRNKRSDKLESLLHLHLEVKELKQIFMLHQTPNSNLCHLFSQLFIWIQSRLDPKPLQMLIPSLKSQAAAAAAVFITPVGAAGFSKRGKLIHIATF